VGRIQRSWYLGKLSWRVLRSDRTLAVFPVLTAVGALIVLGVFGGLIAVAGIDTSGSSGTTFEIAHNNAISTHTHTRAYISTQHQQFSNDTLARATQRSDVYAVQRTQRPAKFIVIVSMNLHEYSVIMMQKIFVAAAAAEGRKGCRVV